MKIGILADTHLGLNRFQRYHSFRNQVNLINEEAVRESFKILKDRKVDKIIHGGDLFDSASPDVNAVLAAKDILDNLEIDTSIIGGNHDYTKKLEVSGNHVFDLIKGQKNIHYYSGNTMIEQYNDVMISYVPYKALGEKSGETFKKLNREVLQNPNKFKILVFHGSIDYNHEMNDDEYDMPMEIVELFDFVTMGHIHTPNKIIMAKNKMVNGNFESSDSIHLTPGSSIPSKRANSETDLPSVYILDTEDNSLESIALESPYKVKEYIATDINLVLEQISREDRPNLHIIEYNDEMSLVDEELYIKAVQNSIKVLIRNNIEIKSSRIEKVEEFWKFMEKKYPNYLKEFKEVSNE